MYSTQPAVLWTGSYLYHLHANVVQNNKLCEVSVYMSALHQFDGLLSQGGVLVL